MGIPRLTRHLLPFSETITLQECGDIKQGGTEHIRSIIIDGPSLVYHVFSRLLSWSDPRLKHFDAQPTCSEVSCGVMMYLLQLAILGVKIEKICFDGALPYQKRETRLARLERSRRRLELFRAKTHELRRSHSTPKSQTINPDMVLRGQALPARLGDIPDNPFIVPAVFEDLRYRWSKEEILKEIAGTMCMPPIQIADYPWADVTVMVPGEADAYCVYLARHTASAVLTNDSDLLLYNLGPHGSVVYLDSITMVGWDPTDPTKSQIKAIKLCPTSVAQRMGIDNILCLAYELKNNPNMGISELVQRARKLHNQRAESPDYRLFLGEYQSEFNYGSEAEYQGISPHLDPRVSELFWQYELREAHMAQGSPHVYLPILNEDHARRCAWTEGNLYRSLAYSIFNLSRQRSERLGFVNEFVRRGSRITRDKIILGDEERIVMEMGKLSNRLKSLQLKLGNDTSPQAFWKAFALREILAEESVHRSSITAPMSRFFTVGHMGEKLEWSDIHLMAQIQSVLYSLRILKQLLFFAGLTDSVVINLKHMLSTLPPLHMIVGSIDEMVKGFPSEESTVGFVDSFRQFEDSSLVENINESGTRKKPCLNKPGTQSAPHGSHAKASLVKPCNIYDLLQSD